MIRTLTTCLMMGLCGAAAAQDRPSLGTVAGSVSGEGSTEAAAKANGVSIERVIAAVVKKTGKKFIIDSRVSGNVVLLGQEVSTVTYNDLLSILLLNGDTAVEAGNYVNVIPESIVRQMPLPMATPKDNFPDGQFVTAVLSVKNVQAATLVPVLRPLLPVHGHLAAVPCGNSLLLVDNFANVKRIEKLVVALDVGKPYATPSCEGDSAHQSAVSK